MIGRANLISLSLDVAGSRLDSRCPRQGNRSRQQNVHKCFDETMLALQQHVICVRMGIQPTGQFLQSTGGIGMDARPAAQTALLMSDLVQRHRWMRLGRGPDAENPGAMIGLARRQLGAGGEVRHWAGRAPRASHHIEFSTQHRGTRRAS